MTNEELETGVKWMGILNAYSNDFATKALLNQTANFLKHNHGQKVRDSKFKKEVKPGTVLNEEIKPLPKPISLMEAKKAFEQQANEEPVNLLAIDETDGDLLDIPKRGRKKNV
jgi:hypothetical protein